jgi:HlyD family secretion protein
MKKIIISIIIIIILVFAVYNFAFKKEKGEFELFEVIKGDIVQIVSETGQVQKGDKINLSFKSSGRIEKIYVEVGEEVEAGDILAKIDAVNLYIQLQEAKAALSLAQAELDKLLAGASEEEIKIAQTAVGNKQIALDTADQGLKDANEDALNTLEDGYLKAYNSQNVVDSIQRAYFTAADQEGIKVREKKKEIEEAVSQIATYLATTKLDSTQEEIDSAFSQAAIQLSKISNALKIIREVCEEPNYRTSVSSTEKTSLDTQRTNINTAITNLTNYQQAIASAKLSIESAKGQLQAAKDDLALLIAPPRQEDIDLYQAQVKQAQSQVNILENQARETSLRAPVKGQITAIKKRVGETVQPALQDVVITLLPAVPFEIKVDIYEEDVVKIDINNPVNISLVAFPEKTFQGKIIAIDPAEKLIEGVVYYEVIIAFEEMPEGIKSGMTADLNIKTASKENVLTIPEDAIQKKDGKAIVEVFIDENIEEKEIEIGLLGSDDMIEVVSGLKEGEKVILR